MGQQQGQFRWKIRSQVHKKNHANFHRESTKNFGKPLRLESQGQAGALEIFTFSQKKHSVYCVILSIFSQQQKKTLCHAKKKETRKSPSFT